MSTITIIIVAICSFAALSLTASVSFVIGAAVGAGSKVKNTPTQMVHATSDLSTVAAQKVVSVTLRDNLLSTFFLASGPRLVCHVQDANDAKRTPERVVLDYTDPNSDQVLQSDTVHLTTNMEGARSFETTIPEFSESVGITIRRPPA